MNKVIGDRLRFICIVWDLHNLVRRCASRRYRRWCKTFARNNHWKSPSTGRLLLGTEYIILCITLSVLSQRFVSNCHTLITWSPIHIEVRQIFKGDILMGEIRFRYCFKLLLRNFVQKKHVTYAHWRGTGRIFSDTLLLKIPEDFEISPKHWITNLSLIHISEPTRPY